MEVTTPDTGYQLKFDDKISEDERDVYLTLYPRIEVVVENRVHCKTCNKHIGTAPNKKHIALMHPVLRVTQCLDCNIFYTSGEFCKGEDGSELYCRWCGQGGEVYCCADCPYVFCTRCITKNISRKYCIEVSKNDNWKCFSCDSKIIWKLRALHWALVNYMEKQIYDISKLNNVKEKIKLMDFDLSVCCQSKKRSSIRNNLDVSLSSPQNNIIASPPLKKRKRFLNHPKNNEIKSSPVTTTIIPTTTSTTTTSTTTTPTPTITAPVTTTIQPTRKIPRPIAPVPTPTPKTTNENEVVCTPDILSMFNNSEENSNSEQQSTQNQVQIQQPTQLILQQNQTIHVPSIPQLLVRRVPIQYRPAQIKNICYQKPVIISNTNKNFNNPRPLHIPVYHTINGYRVDLNSAAQQDTFRLPNGKIIQVKKHNSTAPVAGRPLGQLQTSIRGNSITTIVASNVRQQNPGTDNGVATANITGNITSTVGGTLIISNKIINNNNNKPPMTPIETSLNDFDKRLDTCKEICTHIIGKIGTLRNTNQFRTASRFSDCKNLHIHLTYLCKYAVSRFKTLQDKCNDDIEAINILDPPDTDVDNDDIEIVEPHTTLINLDSDNEDDNSDESTTNTLSNSTNNKKIKTNKFSSKYNVFSDKNETLLTGDLLKHKLLNCLLNNFKNDIEENTLSYNTVRKNVVNIVKEMGSYALSDSTAVIPCESIEIDGTNVDCSKSVSNGSDINVQKEISATITTASTSSTSTLSNTYTADLNKIVGNARNNNAELVIDCNEILLNSTISTISETDIKIENIINNNNNKNDETTENLMLIPNSTCGTENLLVSRINDKLGTILKENHKMVNNDISMWCDNSIENSLVINNCSGSASDILSNDITSVTTNDNAINIVIMEKNLTIDNDINKDDSMFEDILSPASSFKSANSSPKSISE